MRLMGGGERMRLMGGENEAHGERMRLMGRE